METNDNKERKKNKITIVPTTGLVTETQSIFFLYNILQMLFIRIEWYGVFAHYEVQLLKNHKIHFKDYKMLFKKSTNNLIVKLISHSHSLSYS